MVPNEDEMTAGLSTFQPSRSSDLLSGARAGRQDEARGKRVGRQREPFPVNPPNVTSVIAHTTSFSGCLRDL